MCVRCHWVWQEEHIGTGDACLMEDVGEAHWSEWCACALKTEFICPRDVRALPLAERCGLYSELHKKARTMIGVLDSKTLMKYILTLNLKVREFYGSKTLHIINLIF